MKKGSVCYKIIKYKKVKKNEVEGLDYKQIADYIEKIPKFTVMDPPQHTKMMLKRLGDPQKSLKVIHVAGTNGKGSVCAYLASMFQSGGLHTGLFTSPHLVTVRERFMLDGQMISEEELCESFGRIKKVIDEAEEEGLGIPSQFETLLLIAFDYFNRAGAEYLVMETGLGGEKDPTNCLDRPLACVITSISLDHVQYLGDTRAKIAANKAGIIKAGVPVIYDGHDAESAEVIADHAKKRKSPAYPLTDADYQMEEQSEDGIRFFFDGRHLQIPYIAQYQMMNASLAYLTMKKLQEIHGISEEKLEEGIRNVRWPGRMETILPGVIADGAHNADGIAQFIKTVKHFRKDHRIVLLFSAVADKQYEEMIRLICGEILPDAVVTTQVGGEREIPADELAEIFRKYGEKKVTALSDVSAAFQEAYSLKEEGMLFCVGSLYLIGKIKSLLNSK